MQRSEYGSLRCLLLALTFWLAASAGLLLTGCGQAQSPGAGESASKTLYTCGMHPQVIQDKPGNCPICGMKLTPVRKQFGHGGWRARHSTNAPAGERKIKYYKSTMMPGEIQPDARQGQHGHGHGAGL